MTLVMAVVGSIPVGAQLLLASKLYVLLYVFGVVFAMVYNLASLGYAKFPGFTLVPAFRIPLLKKIEISFPGMRFPDVVGKFPVSFVYDPQREFNIIKSPILREEVAFNEFFKTTGFLLEEIRQNKNLKKNISKVQRKISQAFAQMLKSEQLAFLSRLQGILDAKCHVGLDKLIACLEDKTVSNSANRSPKLSWVSAVTRKPRCSLQFRKVLAALRIELEQKNEEVLKIMEKIAPLIEGILHTRSVKVRNYHLPDPPMYAYTIAFVANPFIMPEDGKPYLDPIMKDIDLFIRTVDRALRSFESNEILGKADIWSRIRVVTYFEDRLKINSDNYLVRESSARAGDIVVPNLLVPRPGLEPIVIEWMRDCKTIDKRTVPKTIFDEIDVIFVVSASPEYTRSTARFTDVGVRKADIFKRGEPFQVCFDGFKQQNVINLPSNLQNAQHEYYATVPGSVALNALSATSLTYIHEFAHAMSSAHNGAIVDEYADDLIVFAGGQGSLIHVEPLHIINRLERRQLPGKYTPTPKYFMSVDDVDYHSDLEHPSAGENDKAFYPERDDLHIPCTMDRSSGLHRFDKLLTIFIQNRLAAKFNRKSRTYYTAGTPAYKGKRTTISIALKSEDRP